MPLVQALALRRPVSPLILLSPQFPCLEVEALVLGGLEGWGPEGIHGPGNRGCSNRRPVFSFHCVYFSREAPAANRQDQE